MSISAPVATSIRTRWLHRVGLIPLVVCSVSGRAAAHLGGLSGAQVSRTVPTWLMILTGGAAIGASFLLASIVTDRHFIRSIHQWQRLYPLPVDRLLAGGARVVGVLALVVFVVTGLFGPTKPIVNFAVLGIWVGWWTGYTMSVYLLGNTWPVFNPWRTIAERLPTLDRPYPEWLGTWPSVGGLLVLIWLEVISPLAEQPRILVGFIVVYTVFTLTGTVVYGTETWFRRVDPISRLFRYYGRIAPIDRTEDGIQVRLPTAGATDTDFVEGFDDTAFIIAILWITTFDGLLLTSAWRSVADVFVTVGVPSRILYLAALLVGYGVFVGAYRLAVGYARDAADTTLSYATLNNRFAPPLLAIAAGYHLAHFLSYLLTVIPTLAVLLTNPLDPPATVLLVLPEWFGVVEIMFVLAGHVLAIWAAHATAFELFPGRLQAIRSQYSFVAVMIGYTVVSLFAVAQGNLPSLPYL